MRWQCHLRGYNHGLREICNNSPLQKKAAGLVLRNPGGYVIARRMRLLPRAEASGILFTSHCYRARKSMAALHENFKICIGVNTERFPRPEFPAQFCGAVLDLRVCKPGADQRPSSGPNLNTRAW